MNYWGLSSDTWGGAILGAVLSAIFIPLAFYGIKSLFNWIMTSRPRKKVLGPVANNKEDCTIFIRDFLLPPDSQILAKESTVLPYDAVRNVTEFWADVDGIAMSYVFNALGQVGKIHKLKIARMSQDNGVWDTNIIIIGGQAQKNFDFYNNLENVTYQMDASNIVDRQTGQNIERENGYGYGTIIKVKNQYKISGSGIGFVIGGFGTLGTKAAAYYFYQHLTDLGKKFGSKYFGIIVRAPIVAGEQAVERLPEYDRILR